MKKLYLTFLFLSFWLYETARAADADRMLYLGVIENNLAYVDQAVMDGAYLNKKYNEDYTPLMVACAANDNPAILKSLINAGADFRFKNTKGQNLLTAALNADARPENIRLLINYGINPNESDKTGKTPLYTALINKIPFAALQTLLQNGANPDQPFDFNGNKVYPLTLAVSQNSSPEIIKLLICTSSQDAHFQALTAVINNNDKQNYQLFKEAGLIH